MTLSLLLALTGAIRLGASVGVSESETNAIVELLRESVAETQANELDVGLQILGGATQYLVILEHGATRIECPLPTVDIDRGRGCVMAALRQFVIEVGPVNAAEATLSKPELSAPVEDAGRSIHASVWVTAATLGVATVATAVLGWHASRTSSSLHDQLYVDATFTELERRQRHLQTAAGVSLSVSVVALVGLVTALIVTEHDPGAR